MNRIHVINDFGSLLGGAALECLDLAQKLAERGDNVSIWTTRKSRLTNATLKKHGITRMRPFRVPLAGTLIISGGCVKPPRMWSLFARFRRAARVVVLCNNNKAEPEKIIRRYKRRTRHTPEMVFLSTTQPTFSKQYASAVHPSPIAIEKFNPGSPRPTKTRDTVVIGRFSRDVVHKHHPEDPGLYRQLVSHGEHIRLMGGNQLVKYDPAITECNGISFLETGQETASEFLASLDIFFYRRTPDWPEPFGRVVPEAMLTGLPVVCGNIGGYTALIKHGINGFLCSDTAEAYAILCKLADSAELRQRVGLQARQDMLDLYSPKAMADRLRFYEG